MASVFFSYSHKDEALRDQLESHLALVKNQGLIDAWYEPPRILRMLLRLRMEPR